MARGNSQEAVVFATAESAVGSPQSAKVESTVRSWQSATVKIGRSPSSIVDKGLHNDGCSKSIKHCRQDEAPPTFRHGDHES